jgi:D-alanyl-D-alanine carboxypeptidase/D-alanyl-D-alanine-endopeptidase (penicillin-binding protein 4)
MTCLSAVKAGSTDCGKGLAAEVKTANTLGVPSSSVISFDGAGSNDQGRTTPEALAAFLRSAAATSFGKTLYDALPVLGRNGTLANVESNSLAAGHAQVKTATASCSLPPAKASSSETAWPATPRPRAAVGLCS